MSGAHAGRGNDGVDGVIILAGGAGKRLGGISKADLVVAGSRLLDHAFQTLPDTPVVVVAPTTVSVPPQVGLVMENPPGGGPAAGFWAGLEYLVENLPKPPTKVALMAVDAPLGGLAIASLSRELDAHPDADVALALAGGVAQNILGVFRANWLRAKVREFFPAGLHGCSMRRLLDCLTVHQVVVPPECGQDADTPEDVADLDQVLRLHYGEIQG